MANHELVTCDYAGCDRPFAYRVKGFNLCSTHLFEGDTVTNAERLMGFYGTPRRTNGTPQR